MAPLALEEVTFARDAPFGRLVGVALPDAEDEAGVEALVARLVPEEQAFARSLRPLRRATWAGGRVALRAALADLGLAPDAPILATARGAPALPAGLSGSISHKRTLAVALAAPTTSATLGIDVELARGPRADISGRVLVAAERARLAALPSPEARARELMLAFAAKEAIYKGLDPWLERFIGFGEVELERPLPGGLRATFTPRAGERAFAIELAEESVEGFLVVAARCRPV